MNTKKTLGRSIFAALLLAVLLSFGGLFTPAEAGAQEKAAASKVISEIEQIVQNAMEDRDIPGLSLVIVREGEPVYIKGFGYANLEKQTPVTPETLFEIASTSKAFTALAALKLEEEGKINFDDPVSKYLPWFHVTFEGKKVPVTLRQVIHQTGGIAQYAVSNIPRSNADDALEQSVRNLSGFELLEAPGTEFSYATINYDIIGLIIQEVSGMSFEEYVTTQVLQPLGMNQSRVGIDRDNPLMAKGYKNGFFSPRPYDPPPYRGNNPAGYVITNGKDFARWLQAQMGLVETELYPLMQKSHLPNMRVLPFGGGTLYGMGWMLHKFGDDQVEHSGANPTFGAHIAFSPSQKIGIAILMNTSCDFTGYPTYLGSWILGKLRGASDPEEYTISGFDGKASAASIIFGIFLLLAVLYLLLIVLDVVRGRRKYEGISGKKLVKIVMSLVAMLPFVGGIQLLPYAIQNIGWDVASVWGPSSLPTAMIMLLACMGISYLGLVLSLIFPVKNEYMRSIPLVIILSLLSGGANAVIIFLITSALFTDIKLVYQVYFFGLAFFIYILGRKVIQTRLTEITFHLVLDLRMRLVRKVFLTTYEKFENMKRGRVYATLNDDTAQVANSAGIFVSLITSLITTLCAFAYLASIAFWATAVTLGVAIIVSVLYSKVSAKAQVLFEEARDTREVYMGLLNGMLDGFKELSLRLRKKIRYENDVRDTSKEFKDKMTIASIKFINAFLIGESMLLVVLGSVSFALPRIFPDISTFTLMMFITVLIYLIGPINMILSSIPALMQIRVSWGRIKSFEKDVPANIDPQTMEEEKEFSRTVEAVKAKDVLFSYESEIEDEEGFTVGPIDFEAKKGEITFIIGGNGSGKTTFAKLLTGLYVPKQGSITVDGKDVEEELVGEYFSTVFSDFHLFQKLYDVDMKARKEVGEKYLKMLHLDQKVEFKGNSFTTTDLSGGQKKRLALLQCYLEDSPIYLFDEVAADQDPQFRKFFYRELLPKMKEEGKIVIAITHDDHYFDVADKIIKFDMGKLDTVDATYSTTGA